jgi:hypothetical protein
MSKKPNGWTLKKRVQAARKAARTARAMKQARIAVKHARSDEDVARARLAEIKAYPHRLVTGVVLRMQLRRLLRNA